MSAKLPQKTIKPWGWELLYALTEDYAGKIIFIKKDHRLSLQYHRTKEETMHLFSGSVVFETGDSTSDLKQQIIRPGQSLHLTPGTLHRIKASEDSVILEVSTPELDDVTRLVDDYGRAGK
ncbi:MAG: hypothetical protein PHS35_01805 [Dehalococcoidales bacterium]|nr:hypothetical protein [Dehalococcoidales bacterium]